MKDPNDACGFIMALLTVNVSIEKMKIISLVLSNLLKKDLEKLPSTGVIQS